MRERITHGSLIAVSLLAGIIVPASSALAAAPHQTIAASGSIGIRLVDVPAGSLDDPRARSYIVDQLAPGTVIRRRVEITNSTGSTADVAVYPAAATSSRGTFAFAAGHSQNEVSGWTSVSRNALRLAPGSKAFDTVTVNVPKDASAGERYAVIWAEVSAPAPDAGGVTLVNRVGIRMYLSVGPGGAPVSSFAIGALSAERSASGEPRVVVNIRNNGQRTLGISGSLTLSDGPGGLRILPVPVELGTPLGPGDSRRLTVRLDKRLPAGSWRAHMRLRSGQIERAAAATIRFSPSPATIVSDRSGQKLLAVVALLVCMAMVAFALLLFRWVRRGPRAAGQAEVSTSQPG
ncbi:MAG: hypothetical protein QOJ13_2361 [Gaiellales bacterium]|jgi:hypothetical protein|nr:hypothetical protein [Gaiellales bacterium]